MPITITTEMLYQALMALGTITGFYIAFSTRKKNLAEAASAIADAATKLMDRQEKELTEKNHETEELEEYIRYLLFGIDKLIGQMEKINIKPSFIPKTILQYKSPRK